MTPADDHALLLRLRRGDHDAARTLWSRHAPALIVYARAILRDRHLAEDAVQSVFCRLITLDRRVLAAVADVRPWLATLVRREALNSLRARRRHDARLSHPPAPPAAPPDLQHLADALDALPRRLREPIVLRHVAGLTFDQLALALGLNRSTAATRYRVAAQALRDALATRAPDKELAHG